MDISYSPSFVKQYKKLPPLLQEEVLEKVELFKDTKNHSLLKVHLLHGKLSGYYSFSVNYVYRVLFEKVKNKEVSLLKIGDHSIYQ